jgi:hypothetical protein
MATTEVVHIERRLTDRELVVKFGVLTAIAGILVDAVLAHGLFWDNDPYWTYWITKTFLIMAVYMAGVTLLGLGLWQGVAITAVHTVVLTVYYDWFAPVGLPQEPEWLDMEHLWITGLPAHFLVILLGYLAALWMWRRNRLPERLNSVDSRGNLAVAFVGTVLVLVLDGVITHGLILRSLPGWTYFIQHLLITLVFLLFWGAYVGFDTLGTVIGAVALSIFWLGYGMYLGPNGLPQEVRYLGYEDLWLRAWPGALISSLVGLFIATRALKARALPVLLTLLLPAIGLSQGLPASASAGGACMQITGPDPVDMSHSLSAEGQLQVRVVEKGNRWSHVQNTDEAHVTAKWSAGASNYEVTIDRVMPRHPLGKYTVWNGVVFRHEMHGHTGIGTSKLPLMKPEIGLWGWARVVRDGQEIARMAPAHVMVTKEGPMAGVMLEVDTEEKGLVGVPDGYLTVMWHQIGSLAMPEDAERSRKLIGWIALILAPAIMWLLCVKASRPAGEH